MPFNIDVWSDVSTPRSLLYLPDPTPTFQIINIGWDLHLGPTGWEQPGFDDSNWTPAVIAGSVDQRDTTRFHSGDPTAPFNIGSDQALPDSTYLPANMTGWWARTWGGPNTYQNAQFRQWITVPADFVSIIALDIFMYLAPEFQALLHSNGTFTSAPAPYAAFDGQFFLFVNGVPYRSMTNAIASLVPGTPALFAWTAARPQPGGGGFPEGDNAVVTIWESDTGANVQPWNAVLFRFRGSITASPDVVPQGRSAVSPSAFVTGPWAVPGAPGFRGPIEIARGTGWDGRGASGGQPDGSWGTTDGPTSNGPAQPHTGVIASTPAVFSPGNTRIAQGFVARWTTIEWVRAGCTMGPGDLEWPSGAGDTFTAKICADAGGSPGIVLGTSVVAMSGISSLVGPVRFHFSPPVGPLTQGVFYWITIETTVAYATVALPYFYWTCDPAPPSPLQPVVYGNYETSQLTLRGDTLTRVQAIPACLNPAVVPDTHAAWDLAIGGDGIAVSGMQDLFSSPLNGQGTGGIRDPNCDVIFPSMLALSTGAPVSGWNYEIGSQSLHAAGQIFQVMGMYANTGDPWMIVTYFSAIDGTVHWGPVQANKTAGDIALPWDASFSPIIAFDARRANNRAVRRSDGSFIALLNTRRSETDSITGLTSQHGRIGYQTLSSSRGGSFSSFQVIEITDTLHQEVLDCIVDNKDIAHVFFAGIAVGGAESIYHVAIGPNGTVGLVGKWDTYRTNTCGTGCVTPTNQVTVPYRNSFGCMFEARWPSDLVTIKPTLLELPQHTLDNVSAAGEATCLAYSGTRGYFFTFIDSGSIAAATIDPGGVVWSALVEWFHSDPTLPTGLLSAAFVPSRGLIGVVFGSGFYGWFQYYVDPSAGYPIFVPTGCAQPISGASRSFGQIVGA